jgi:ubiquinone biosynthesis protein
MTSLRDCEWAAFDSTGPWEVPTEGVAWLDRAAELRTAARREIPVLTVPSRIPPVRRLATVVWVLGTALGPWWWRKRRGRFASQAESRAFLSLRLRRAVERLGSTYIKLGQIISSGEGLFPPELVEEFKRCRDQVPPVPFDTVRAVVEADLGGPLESVFASFDREPLAAASIAQVHLATLPGGEEVVVKVQRPAVSALVRRDLKVMSWLAPHLVGRIKVTALANPPALVELFAETIVEELDFRIEASNMIDVARVLRDLGQDGYVVPRPHPVLVAPRVLVMQRLSGFKFDDVAGMRGAGIDTEAVIRTGMVAFMEGALIHGVFHGDLHGGNLFVLPDGRTALLDFGIVGRLTGPRRMAFLRLMLNATTNNVVGQVEALRDLGALPADTDVAAVIRDLNLDSPVDPTTLSGEELVQEVQRVVKAMLGYGARMPKELMLYVKNLVFLDGAIARLAPDLDLLGEIASISMLFAQRHGERLGRELGIDHTAVEINLDSVKATLGVDLTTDTMTYRDLQRRRELIQRRMREHVGR